MGIILLLRYQTYGSTEVKKLAKVKAKFQFEGSNEKRNSMKQEIQILYHLVMVITRKDKSVQHITNRIKEYKPTCQTFACNCTTRKTLNCDTQKLSLCTFFSS